MKWGRLFTSPCFSTVKNSKFFGAYYFVLTVSDKVFSEYLSYSVRSVKSKLLSIRYEVKF